MGYARHLATAAVAVAGATAIARLAGFARTIVFTDSVRSAGVGSIYNSVNALPNVVFEVAAGGMLAAVAVPVIAAHLGRGDVAGAHRSSSALMTWSQVVLIPLAAVLAVLASPIATALIGDASAQSQAVAVTMLRIVAIQVPLYGMGIVLVGVVNAHRRFVAAAVAPLLSSLVVISSYLAYGALADGETSPSRVSGQAIQLLAWGTTAGVMALSLPLWIPALRTGWRWRWTLTFPPGDRKRAWQLGSAGLIALVAQQLSVLVIVWVNNHEAIDGSQSVYQYIQAVYLLPYAILAGSLATIITPALAHAEGAGESADGTVSRAIKTVVITMSAAAAVLVVAAPQVQRFFRTLDARRGGGTASSAALDQLAGGLSAIAPGLVGMALIGVLSRVLYVRGQARRAGAVIAGGWAIAGLLPLLVAPLLGPDRTLIAIGGAGSLGMTGAGVLLVVLTRQSWGARAVTGLGATALASAIGAGLAILIARPVSNAVVVSGIVPIVGVALAAGAWCVMVFIGVLWLIHRPSLRFLDPRLLRKGGV